MSRLWGMINKQIFIPPAIVLVIFVLYGLLDPTGFGKGADLVLNWTLKNFSWFYAIGATLLLAFCFWAGFSKYGNIKLGGRDAVPEMSKFNWFAISLCAGIAIGIVFWGVAEPMTHFMNPPPFLDTEPGSRLAGESALRFSFFHWTFHTYGIYVSAALCIAFFFYNCKKPFKVSSSLYPLIGEKIRGRLGALIDGLAIFAIVGGVATSLGFGAMQIGGGLNYLWGIPPSKWLWLAIIIVCTIFYTISSYSGLHRGIKFLSQTNIYLYFALIAFILFCGPTINILDHAITAIGDYIINVIPMSFYLDPMLRSGWPSSWSIFYWAWWLAYAPIVGLFLVRCAYGRTIREFVVVNLLAPCAFGILWMSVNGAAAIQLENLGAGIWEAIQAGGIEVALFALFKELPLSFITIILGCFCVAISFITLADSMTSTIASMTTKGFGETREDKEAPAPMKIFWGVVMGLLSYVLLISGGIGALQTSVIVCGLPILVLQLIMAYAYIKAMMNLKEYDLVNPEEAEALSKVPEYHIPRVAEADASGASEYHTPRVAEADAH